jgi:cytoskeletal protein CcmA (bactofilin family)
MSTPNKGAGPNANVEGQDSSYTDAQKREPSTHEQDRSRRQSMFTGKKTDETEWSRFSKALSSREREEAEGGSEGEPAPALSGTVVQRGEGNSSAVLGRTPSELGVSARPASRSTNEQSDDVESTIGEHTTVDGSFKSENSIRVRGTVQGEIESRRSIYIDEQANVTAKVTAAAVTVAGQINGQIYCAGRVELRPTGRIIGEIHAGTLIMQEGAFFEGQLKMGANATSSVSSSQPVAS